MTHPTYCSALLACINRVFASQGRWEDASRDLSAGLRADPNDVRRVEELKKPMSSHLCRIAAAKRTIMLPITRAINENWQLLAPVLPVCHRAEKQSQIRREYSQGFIRGLVFLFLFYCTDRVPISRPFRAHSPADLTARCSWKIRAGNVGLSYPQQLDGYLLRGNALLHVRGNHV